MNTAVIEREAPAVAVVPPQPKASILVKIASRYSVEPTVLLDTLKNTAFRQRDNQPPVTNEQMVALLVVADQYKLNPFTKEIYAFPDKGGIVPVVGVDGWARIINEHPAFDGMDFNDGPADKAGAPEWIECVMYRKDRTHPTKVRERMSECRRSTPPWQSHPTRMLRHKAMIQCARIAFGFAGIYDEDEAERIIERDMGKATVAQDPTNKLAPRAKAPTDQPPTPPAGETTAASPAAQASTSQPDVPPRPATAPTVGDGGADPSNAAAPADLAAEGTPTADKSGPGSTDAAAPILLAPSQRAILEKRMKAAEITAADVHKKFGKGLEFITVEEFQAVAAFIANPAGK
jgi:phage recombination protein Bet